ncbi:hypothetical protein BDB01DRAFT_751572 [Pilobolus umbonatus]|nr:hypothetical protein BDB01DRAFT_751572 [Pilobolus umbonatus]
MRFDSLGAELDAITKEFDYGIVPGSATIFVRDELHGIGRLDLTLLEGVMIVLEVTDRGYKVTSCSPLCNIEPAVSTAHTVQSHLETPFESMENLLMTISPMFRERFQQALYSKLQSVQNDQLLNTDITSDYISQSFMNQDMHNSSNSSNINHMDTLNTSSPKMGSYDEINKWIH